MKPQCIRSAIVALAVVLLTATSSRGDDSVETIVSIRHSEKPGAGLGQLNCNGLNRALALPQVIAKSFGKPARIFAPDPSDRKLDGGEVLRLHPPAGDYRAHCNFLRPPR
jgi:hypothetical protein